MLKMYMADEKPMNVQSPPEGCEHEAVLTVAKQRDSDAVVQGQELAHRLHTLL